MVLMGRATDWL